MDNNDPNQPHWKFDPETGQPLSESAPANQTPADAQPPAAAPGDLPPAYTQPQQPPATGNTPPPTQPIQPPPQPTYTPPPGYAPPAQPTQPYSQPQQPTQPYQYTPQQPYYQPPQPQQPYQQPAYAPPPQQVNVTEKRSGSKAPLVLGVLVVLLLLVGGGLAYYFLSVVNKTLNAPALAAERALPANTLGYLTIAANPSADQKAALDQMRQAFDAQPGFKQAWNKLTQQISDLGAGAGLATPGTNSQEVNFDTLSSYLGSDLTLAVLSPSTTDLQQLQDASDPSAAGDVVARNVVGLVDLDFNPLDKKGPLVDFKQQTDNPGKAELAENYKGVDIRKYISGTTTVYFSLLPDSSTAAVGAQVEPVRAVIDQVKGGTSLKDDATFKTLSGQVPQNRLASVYINLKQLYSELQIAAPETFNSGTVQQLDGAMLMTLSAQNDGMQLDVASEANVQGVGVQINPNSKPDSRTLADIPQDSLGFLAGTDLKTTAQSVLDSLRKQEQASGDTSVTDTLDQFQQSTGLNLETDVLPLLGGDYALSAGATNGDTGPSPYAVFQIKLNGADRDKAAQTLDKLVQSAAGGEQVSQFNAGGGTFYVIGPEGTGVVAGVTSDRLLVVVDSNTDAARSRVDNVTGNLQKGLGTTTQWRDISKRLPNDSNSIIYLDITGTRSAAETTMDSESKQSYDQDTAPFLRPFKYLLIGSATQASKDGNLSRNHTVIFLGIGK